MQFGNTTVRALDAAAAAANEDVRLVLRWQEGAAEALEKGYLRAMVLSIYTAEERREDRRLVET